MRILITGSRQYPHPEVVEAAIFEAIVTTGTTNATIIHGDYPTGADAHAHAYARKHDLQIETHPADWKREGRKAGPNRNQRMVDTGPDLCLAFPTSGSVGTWDCVRRANEAGIPTRIYNSPTP